ncbi:hypothetical protein V3C99_017065 [Haemonchus contortus]|uniref:Cyclin N-terminal domain-containing protein n=1 Tax=Haemonchus contortus TaxID=6289 RepID=A0A7I4Z013_HAECO
MDIDSYESLTTRIGRLRLRRYGSTPVLTIFVAYAATLNYEKSPRSTAEELHIGTHGMGWRSRLKGCPSSSSRPIPCMWDHIVSLASKWEDSVIDNIDEEYNRLVEHLHDSATKAESLQVARRRLSSKTLELIRQRGIARATGNYQQTSELAK